MLVLQNLAKLRDIGHDPHLKEAKNAPTLRDPAKQDQHPAVSIAATPRDVKSALHLVYDAYIDGGLIKPNQYEIRVTPFHLLETTEVLIAKRHGEIACTMTLVRDGKLRLADGGEL